VTHTPADPIDLIPLRSEHFAPLTALARRIWRSHYRSIIGLDQIEYMLGLRFTDQNLTSYLHSQTRWLDLLWHARRPIGYCSYALGETQDELRLEQLYVAPELHRRGFGGRMLEHVEAQCRARQRVAVVLTVNKANATAIAMYRRRGFSVRSELCIDIGHGFVMDDFVMHKVVTSAAETAP
jgi:diamine N-acetyltransferase